MIKTTEDDYVLIDRRFTFWLGALKGPRLAVLMSLILHADERGHSKVGLSQLAAETGFVQPTITRTLRELYRFEADGITAVTLLGPEMRGRGNINCYALFKPAVATPVGARSKQ